MVEDESFFFEPGNDEMFNDYAELHNLVDCFDNEDHVDYTADYFLSSFSSAGINLSREVVLVRNQNTRLIGSGAMFLPINSQQAKLVIQVHPSYRRQGIGTRLFECIREEGLKRGVKEFALRALSFRPYAIAFAKSFGFCKTHSSLKMRLDFTEPVKPALHPWGFKVRALNPRKELDLWASLQNALFQDFPGYIRVTPRFLESRITHIGFDPNLILLGEVKDIPIGLCVGWTLPPQGNKSSTRVLRIEGIGILPDHRRNGYGFSFLQEVMNRAYLKGHTRAELIVGTKNTAAIGMYLKHGFERQYEHLWYTYPCY